MDDASRLGLRALCESGASLHRNACANRFRAARCKCEKPIHKLSVTSDYVADDAVIREPGGWTLRRAFKNRTEENENPAFTGGTSTPCGECRGYTASCTADDKLGLAAQHRTVSVHKPLSSPCAAVYGNFLGECCSVGAPRSGNSDHALVQKAVEAMPARLIAQSYSGPHRQPNQRPIPFSRLERAPISYEHR